MSDTRYLDWPFFEARHRELAQRLDAWAARNLVDPHGGDVDGIQCRNDSRQGCGGEFTDGVAGDDHVLRQSVRALDLLEGEERSGHDERLGHGGVGDLLRRGGGSEPRQVEARRLRPEGETIPGPGESEPRHEHAGCLRALSGRKHCNHGTKKTL